MKSRASLMAMLAIAAGTLLGAASGCELIASVDRSKIEGAGGGGTGGATAGGGTGGTPTGGGGTGGMTGCTEDTACPAPADECKVAKCDTATGVCGEADAADGTALKNQTAGNCLKEVCKAGAAGTEPDATDVLDDSNACTADTCDAANMPVSAPTAAGTTCAEGVNTICNGSGVCVECLVDADCKDAAKPACGGDNTCQPATCNDGKINGDETATDCGGACDKCADLLACKIPGDCQSGVCTGMVCQVPTCDDGVKNGTEGDVDCGATCGAKTCGPNLGCNGDADCKGNQCTGMMAGTCVPNCADAVKNNVETDTDCGGGTCGVCNIGQGCGNSDANCQGNAYCNAGTCAAKQDNGTSCVGANQCTSGACADTVCCSAACTDLCNACVTAKTGLPTGTCGAITNNTDPDAECAGTDVCNGSGACAKAKGTACGAAGECATGNCVDGVCCDTACLGACKACSNAKTGAASGTCSNVATGTDPDNECVGALSCTAAGACASPLANGGACTLDAECANGHCVDGVCCDQACGGTCQACTAAKKGSGADGACGSIAIHTDPDNECAGALECSGGTSCLKAVAAVCAANTECQSNFCADGVCCNAACNGAAGSCEACNLAGTVGTCSPIPAGDDPASECAAADCNGGGACGLGATGAPCVAGAMGVCNGGANCPAMAPFVCP